MAGNNNQTLRPGTVLRSGTYSYRILKVLGQGSFGITYLASVQIKAVLGSVDVQVALKEYFAFDEDARCPDGNVLPRRSGSIASLYAKAFQRESDTLSKMNHPGIVRVLECFEANGTLYYSMEYLSGGSLNEKVTGRPMSESEALPMIAKVGDALSYMHSHGMMHLDMKPLNIVLKEDGSPVLVDFGLARRIDQDGRMEDIFALGATLYKMLTGYAAPVAPEIDRGGFPEDRLKELSVSSRTATAIRKAMDPHPLNRPQSVDAFLSMLDHPSNPSSDHPGRNPCDDWDDFAIYLGYPECLLGGMGPDLSLHILDSWAPTVFNTDRDLFRRERLESLLAFLLDRFMKIVDLTRKDVRIILPSYCDCSVFQSVRDACDKWGIKRFRTIYEDRAAAFYFYSRPENRQDRKLELNVVTDNGFGGKRHTRFVLDNGIRLPNEDREDDKCTLSDAGNNVVPSVGSRDFITIHSRPKDALAGSLCKNISSLGGALQDEPLRGGPLQLAWGQPGEPFKTIVPDKTRIPCDRTVRIKLADALNFCVFQGAQHCYLGGIFLDEGMIRPEEEVTVTLYVDSSMMVSLSLMSRDFWVRKTLLRPVGGNTLPIGRLPRILIGNCSTDLFSTGDDLT